MGIKGQHKLSNKLTDIDLNELITIGKYRALRRQHQAESDGDPKCTRPCIDVDASWIVRSVTVIPQNRESYLWQLCLFLSCNGFDVFIVCDGDVRHHSKRTTTERKAKSHWNRVEYHKLKCELMSLVDKAKASANLNEKNVLSIQQSQITKKIRTKEKEIEQSIISVGDNLFNSLLKRV